MGAPRKFDDETRARAVRMYPDRLRDHGGAQSAGRRHVGELLDITPKTLRHWVEIAERAAGTRAASPADEVVDVEEVRRLRRENAELRRANDILKTASAFFAQAELDRRLK